MEITITLQYPLPTLSQHRSQKIKRVANVLRMDGHTVTIKEPTPQQVVKYLPILAP